MNIVLIGGGTQLSYSIDIIEKQDLHKIVGIIDSKLEVGIIVHDYKVIGRQENINHLKEKHDIEGCVITIGDNWSRFMIYSEVSKLCPEIYWPNAIHPSVIIGKGVSFGKGILIMAGVIVNTGAIIGDFANCYTNSNVEHDCCLGEYSSISAGVVLGGKVKIGKFSAISLNATIFDRVSIGENSVIGSASLITKDIPDNVLVYGNPGRIIRNREKGEKFLK